jgi:hypothetical protein
VTVELYGNANLRRDSQMVRLKLLDLMSDGLVRPLDDQKPIAWCRTKAGTEALHG